MSIVQIIRLLDEAVAQLDGDQLDAMAESMDLSRKELDHDLTNAGQLWDQIKDFSRDPKSFEINLLAVLLPYFIHDVLPKANHTEQVATVINMARAHPNIMKAEYIHGEVFIVPKIDLAESTVKITVAKP